MLGWTNSYLQYCSLSSSSSHLELTATTGSFGALSLWTKLDGRILVLCNFYAFLLHHKPSSNGNNNSSLDLSRVGANSIPPLVWAFKSLRSRFAQMLPTVRRSHLFQVKFEIHNDQHNSESRSNNNIDTARLGITIMTLTSYIRDVKLCESTWIFNTLSLDESYRRKWQLSLLSEITSALNLNFDAELAIYMLILGITVKELTNSTPFNSIVIDASMLILGLSD